MELKLKIDADRLLLVEGRDEVNLFKALLKHCLDNKSEIQVIDAGGINKFPVNLKAIHESVRARPSFQSLGVVRDADDNADSAFRSICDHLRKAGYTPPAVRGEFSDAVPSSGVFIVPGESDRGAIETLCRRSVEDTDLARCVDEYIKCLQGHNVLHSRNVDKSFAHAYLAAMSNPMARVGEGAQSGVWDFESPGFTALSRFLRDLASQGA